jgi:xylan 1,4-beta-xylosidase
MGQEQQTSPIKNSQQPFTTTQTPIQITLKPLIHEKLSTLTHTFTIKTHFLTTNINLMLRKYLSLLLFISLFTYSCRQTGTETTDGTTGQDTTAVNQAASPQSYANPVLPGDYPDPSVTKVGDTYWATATSSEWGPLFPLLRSTNLVDWELVGHAFPDKLPEWTEANFWAPEISHENGRTYIYYTARKKGGPLCVGVASADQPEGPYRDHGALVCQDAGAIDGFPIRDENGQLYLIWKEDGNSRNLPTPLWGQRMNEERTALTGERFELFRNDPDTWEGRLVEGPALIRRGDYFYTFYAGDACCGRECTYAQGVARARSLTGPWEKYSGNPILTHDDTWKCPGHGTVITTGDDRYMFLYHAYSTESSVYAGRQGILSEFTWTADGWPQFRNNSPAAGSKNVVATELNVSEEFSGQSLNPAWQWPVGRKPKFTLTENQLRLGTQPNKLGAALAHRTKTAAYTANVTVNQPSIAANERAGLAAIGDPDNAIGVWVSGGKISLWQTKGGKEEKLVEAALPPDSAIQVRVNATGGNQFRFGWSADGNTWNELNPDHSLDGSYLPPWDRAIRIGLLAKGPATGEVHFDNFRLENE